MALMVGLTVAAQAGVNHAPTHPPQAGSYIHLLPYIEQDSLSGID